MTPDEAKSRIRSAVEPWIKAARDGKDRPPVDNQYGTEYQETARVIQWLEAHGIVCFGVPNAGKRGYRAASALKAQGMRRGVPDIIVATPPPCGGYGATAIEMKRVSGGTMSLEQHQWLERLRGCKWATNVCAGASEAISWLEGMGYGK